MYNINVYDNKLLKNENYINFFKKLIMEDSIYEKLSNDINKINNFYEYIIYINKLDYTNYDDDDKCDEILFSKDINDLKVENYDEFAKNTNLCVGDEIYKYLKNSNFNFNLLSIDIIINNIDDEDIIKNIIDNKLYNFSNIDEIYIIKNCKYYLFKFFIKYLNFDVYKDFNGNTLHHLLYENSIYNFNNYTNHYNYRKIIKSNILINDYNLYPNANDYLQDIGNYKTFKYPLILLIHKNMEILDKIVCTDNDNDLLFNDLLVKIILLINISGNRLIKMLYVKILDKINNLDIKILDNIKCYLFMNADLNTHFYKAIIKKLNIDIHKYYNYIQNLDVQYKDYLIYLYKLYIDEYIYNIISEDELKKQETI